MKKSDPSAARVRAGSAIAMVAVFLAFVAIIAIGVSFQGNMVRGGIQRSQRGVELVEICESAINEAASQVVQEDVFPPAVFSDMRPFFFGMITDDEQYLKSNLSGYTPHMGNLVDSSGQVAGKVFCALEWPKDFKVEKEATKTAVVAAKLAGFKGPLGKVTAKVIAFHRDYFGKMWQDWGVMQFRASASVDDGQRIVTRTMYADRLFSLNVTTPPICPDGQPGIQPGMLPKINCATVYWLPPAPSPQWPAYTNLRTIIERS